MSAYQRSESSRGGPACPPIHGLTGEHGKQRNCRGGPACPPIRGRKSETGKSDTIHILGGHMGPPLQYIFWADTRVRPYSTYFNSNSNITPGTPSNPTTMALRGLITKCIPHIPPIKFITNNIIPPNIPFHINFMIHFKGTSKTQPITYNKISPTA